MLFQVKPMIFMLIGCFIGFWVGILPGLGGVTTLALMLPFIYKMTPIEALPFLLGMHSVIQTTGDITSVLFGIPGEATTVATIIDGHPMAENGEAGRALGAALMSSLVGAVFGALFLACAIPIVRPLVLAFGSPEMLMMIVVGLACISSLSGQGARGIMAGVTMGVFGFMLSLVGQDPQKGILRFTFDTLYLIDGIPLVPAVIGLFAIPEIVDLTVRGTSISGDRPLEKLGGGAIQGIKDTFIHFWLVIRCSLIGSLIGVLPGLGGGVSQWVAYAHAVQSAKTKEERDMGELLREVQPEDLLKFGLIPEFIGRLPVIATLSELSLEALVDILKKPKNALVKQYQKLFEFENVKLRFTEGALTSIAKEAIKRKSGARGLRAIMENTMLDVMYELPSQQNIRECIISEEAVLNHESPILLYEKEAGAA